MAHAYRWVRYGRRPIDEALAALELVDHHCHGAVTADLDRPGFEALLTEGEAWPGVSPFDTPVGLAVRRHCAPLLDLPGTHRPTSTWPGGRSWGRRGEPAVPRGGRGGRLLRRHGLRPDAVTTPRELASAAGAAGYEVVRLESVAEAVAARGVEPDAYAEAFGAAAEAAVRRPGVVGVKSVAAYRTGFDLDPARPAPGEVTQAARRWLGRGGRLADPVLVRHLLWTAVDLGLPLQLHTGFGDADLHLHKADPSLLTDWLRLTAGTVPVLLLHCWPYQRQAAYLTAVFEQVHLDVGLTLHHVGPARAGAVLAEALEITPFRKLLYSSDAYGLAEFHHLGALAFRQGLGGLLRERVAADEMSPPDAVRLARWAGRDNGLRVYGLPGGPRTTDDRPEGLTVSGAPHRNRPTPKV